MQLANHPLAVRALVHYFHSCSLTTTCSCSLTLVHYFQGGRERLLLQLPNGDAEDKAPDVDACFHVAIDLPGFGLSAKDPKRPWSTTETADILSDIFRSLGKTHAYALVGSETSCSFILKALAERPAFARFVILQEPLPAYYLPTHYSLLTPHYSLLTAHCSLLTTHYSLLITH